MILLGDALTRLKEMDAGGIDCCVTSPPYWGLRDYGVEGQLGLEKTPEEFVEKMVVLFREVRRVLRDDGTLWLNLGDSYAASSYGTGGGWAKGKGKDGSGGNSLDRSLFKDPGYDPKLPLKNLIGVPWRVAFALQADGWILRQDIVWHKPNPMPESIKDRCTKAHEYIFLLSKSPRYYFDAEAIKEPCSPNTHARMARAKPEHSESMRHHGGKGKRSMGPRVAGVNPKALANSPGVKQNESFAAAVAGKVDRRNKRSVWTVGTEPYKGAHFATFPTKLIKPCILAGCRPGGTVLDPFLGSGTTGYVALAHNRKFIGIELNPEYAELARRRTGAEIHHPKETA